MDSVHANRMRERGRTFVPLTAALLLIFWTGVASGQVTLEKIVSDNKDAMVFLRAKVTLPTGEIRESTGTGFLLDAEGYVLTASHVLSPAGIYDKAEIFGAIKTRYGQSWPMDVIEDNSRRDLLLLKFKNVGIKWSAVSLGAPTRTSVGAKLFTLGYPLSEDLAAKDGSLSNKNGPGGSWTTTVPLNLGDSGAPVFDDKGRVVAIVVSGVPEARGIAYCLPLNYAASLLSIVGVTLATELPLPLQTTTTEISTERTLILNDLTEAYLDTGRKLAFFDSWGHPPTLQTLRVQQSVLTATATDGRVVSMSVDPNLLPTPSHYNASLAHPSRLGSTEAAAVARFFSSYSQFREALVTLTSTPTNFNMAFITAMAFAREAVNRGHAALCVMGTTPPRMFPDGGFAEPVPPRCAPEGFH